MREPSAKFLFGVELDRGPGSVYRLDPMHTITGSQDIPEIEYIEHVVVSRSAMDNSKYVQVFASDSKGNIMDWIPLAYDTSARKALKRLGYKTFSIYNLIMDVLGDDL